jgi:dTDP-4-amino-4,6-dideoxy-D-galactose acyltransferase
MPSVVHPATGLLSRLDWDTEHFGFPVARIDAAASDGELQSALTEARACGYRLVYWSASHDRQAPSWLLTDFDGQLADRKMTFAQSLEAYEHAPIKSDDVTIELIQQANPSAELVALAIAAGEYSRFALDPRLPHDKFESLYRIWIERSVSGEIAGAVLVACDSASPSLPAGMITVKVTSGVGNIGLVAVAASHRGRGVGSKLIAAAHRWMREHGAKKATVVTQGDNAPACRLYERAGYAVEHAENVYHFWP